MAQDTTTFERKWYDSPHASLCLLGAHLRRIGFFAPLEAQVQIKQKAIKYTPVQKLEMLLVALLAGAKAVAHTGLTIRVDPAHRCPNSRSAQKRCAMMRKQAGAFPAREPDVSCGTPLLDTPGRAARQ